MHRKKPQAAFGTLSENRKLPDIVLYLLIKNRGFKMQSNPDFMIFLKKA